jgi:hypothetical protein
MRTNLSTVRNVAIVLLIALVLVVIPGGGTAGSVVLSALSFAFLGALAWAGSIVYREHRGTIYLLGERRRALLYGAIAVLAVTLAATSRLWSTNIGGVAWLVLVGVSIYVGCAVVVSARRA